MDKGDVKEMIVCGCDLGGNCFECTQPTSKWCEGSVNPPGYFEYDPVEKNRIEADKKKIKKQREHERYLKEREKRLARAKERYARNRQAERNEREAVS